MTLVDAPVLLLDIQASAAASAGGALLEVGWQPHPAPAPAAGIQTHLAQMATAEISPRLARMTGLSAEMMQSGQPPDEIWKHLQIAARTVAAANALAGGHGCPVVVHYARFEAPYLKQMQSTTNNQDSQWVHLDLICTHEIARRLLPGLPRKGLRAVAGYFGHDTSPLRRCCHHLAATDIIWSALAAQLSSHCGIDTFVELKAWIQETPVPRPGVRQFQVPMQAIRELPSIPGIYRFLSSTGTALYVGKAKDLNQRVRTYFQPRRRHPEHILEMLSRAAAVKSTPMPTALEAALLEQDLIKRLAPPYNIALHPNAAGLQFWSRDLASQAPQCDARHPWGPVPAGVPVTLLAALVKALAAGGDHAGLNRLRATLMGAIAQDPSREEVLDRTCLAAGLALFQHTHEGRLKYQPFGRSLLAVGKWLWLQRKNDAKEEIETATDEAFPEAHPLWTPERVCRHLEHAVCHAGALLRRSRWLVLLGNATLAWGLPNTNTERYRRLVFREGLVTVRESLPRFTTASQVKAPPQHRCWRPQDRITYDRLRVATTELRRLVREARPIAIALSGTGGSTLNRQRLARLLRWL